MSACPRSVGWSICDSVNWSVGRCVRCFGMYIGWLVGGRSVGRSVGRPAGRLAVLTPALLFVARLRRATRHSSHFFLFPFFTRLNTYVCVLRHRFRQESQRALSLKTLREEEEAEVHYTRCVGGVLSLGLLVDFLAWFADCFYLLGSLARSLVFVCFACATTRPAVLVPAAAGRRCIRHASAAVVVEQPFLFWQKFGFSVAF